MTAMARTKNIHNLPLELADLVQIGLREYAGQVPETQYTQGGWGFGEPQDLAGHQGLREFPVKVGISEI